MVCAYKKNCNVCKQINDGFLQVLSQQSHDICGKKVDPKKAKPQERHDPGNKVFVGGLERSTTEDEIREAFTPRGEVSSTFI